MFPKKMLSSPTLVNGFETENEAADRSNQPNPKSYTPRKLALETFLFHWK